MPSVICTNQECNFHKFIVLEDWPGGEYDIHRPAV